MTVMRFLVTSLIFLSYVSPAQDLAFPHAEGWGRFSQGGRGGRVIFVTNRNDSGVGSFRDACNQTGPRIVVFQVAGQITLQSTLRIVNPFITIAGQTAPGDGVWITGANDQAFMRWATNQFIVRGVRFRMNIFYEGQSDHQSIYAVDIVDPSRQGIFDHCSFEFSDDSILQLWKHVADITIQNSIIACGPWEGMNLAGTKTGVPPAERISLISNLFAHNQRRNPNSNFIVNSEYANNVIYNPRFPGADLDLGTRVDIRGNVVIPGPNTPVGTFYDVQQPNSNMALFIDGNLLLGGRGDRLHNAPSDVLESSPVGSSGYVPRPASEVVQFVSENVGPFPRDALDQQIIDDMLNGEGHWVQHPRELGGFPVLVGTPRTSSEWDEFVLGEGGLENALNSYYEEDTDITLTQPVEGGVYNLTIPLAALCSEDVDSVQFVVDGPGPARTITVRSRPFLSSFYTYTPRFETFTVHAIAFGDNVRLTPTISVRYRSFGRSAQ